MVSIEPNVILLCARSESPQLGHAQNNRSWGEPSTPCRMTRESVGGLPPIQSRWDPQRSTLLRMRFDASSPFNLVTGRASQSRLARIDSTLPQCSPVHAPIPEPVFRRTTQSSAISPVPTILGRSADFIPLYAWSSATPVRMTDWLRLLTIHGMESEWQCLPTALASLCRRQRCHVRCRTTILGFRYLPRAPARTRLLLLPRRTASTYPSTVPAGTTGDRHRPLKAGHFPLPGSTGDPDAGTKASGSSMSAGSDSHRRTPRRSTARSAASRSPKAGTPLPVAARTTW